MEQVVYKYELEPNGNKHEALMPPLGKVLRIDAQGSSVCVWALVNPLEFKTIRVFEIYGTGHPIKDDGLVREFVNTFLVDDGRFVFHAFEVRAKSILN